LSGEDDGKSRGKDDSSTAADLSKNCNPERKWSGKAGEQAHSLCRYMLRVKQMEVDVANFNEDIEHTKALQEEFEALKVSFW
jgi:hypothetical protein